jgi:hypothetical protein
VCTEEEVCTTDTDCVDNPPNQDYDYNPGLCRKDPTLLRCYEYLDPNGNPTHEPQTCTEQTTCETVTTCEDVTTCQSVDSCEGLENCEASITCEPVDSCNTADPGCHFQEVCTGTGFDPTVDNPYDYANMECLNVDGTSGWAYTDGSNPRYVKGLCAAPTINLSANTILTAECGDATSCLEAFPISEYFDDLDMVQAEGIAKILTWEQYGPAYGDTTTDTTLTNLDDVSWENPYDVAKGHRGFLVGDMVMVLYAWAPNWQALTEAHDAFNLYIRRSFDGGRTFTTLPGSFNHTNGITYSGNGTTTCEWMFETDWAGGETPICTTYGAGEFEQTRNVSQLVGSAVTIIDPRYAPTTASITAGSVSTTSLPAGFTAPLYLDDVRDPSRYFIVYETGANSPYDVGEAEPLNLYYSRGVEWGDEYLVWQDYADANACLPSADTEDEFDLTGFCNEFDALEGSQFAESGEAAVTASPGGMFMYADWNQLDFDQSGEEVGSDAWFRRVLFLDDYVPTDDNGSGEE